MKYLYIRQNIDKKNLLIIGDESYEGGRDYSYTHKGSTIKNSKGKLTIEYPRVTRDIELTEEYPRDYHVHKFIKEKCYDLVSYLGNKNTNNESNTREGFKIIGSNYEETILELYKRINCELHGNNACTWLPKQGPQKEAVKNISKFLESTRKEFLLNAFCRMGKTFATMYSFEQSNFRSALFLSGKTEAIRECKLTKKSCNNFDDIDIISLNELDTYVGGRYIIADTCQALQRRYKACKSLPIVDVVFFDECHYYNTEDISTILQGKFKKIVYMSATPENLLNSGNYDPRYKNIYEFTLTDLYKKLEKGQLSPDEYILPKMFIPSIETYVKRLQEVKHLKESTIKYLNECTNDNGFSFSSFLEIDKSKTFFHADEVRLFAKALYLFLKDAGRKINYNGNLMNFMIFMPQNHVKTEEFAKLLRENLSDNDNVFVTVSNNEGVNKDDKLSQIKSSMSAKKGLSIVLTYQRFGTGCTLEDLEAVMFLNDTDNCSVILQNLSRCLSANNEKKYGVVFEMNQSRAITDRFKIICSKYGKILESSKAQRLFNEVKNLMPINLITEFGDLQEVPLNYDEAVMSYKKLNGASNIFDGELDIDELKEILKDIENYNHSSKLTNKQAAIRKAIKVISSVKGRGISSSESIKVEDIRAKLLTLSNYLKTCWYCSEATSINAFIKFFDDNENQEDFMYSTSIKWTDFKRLILPHVNQEKFKIICNDFSETNERVFSVASETIYTPSSIFSLQ